MGNQLMSAQQQRPLDKDFEMPSFRLDGRTALVTGGSRGLGLGMALALAHAGADIALAARTVDQLDAAAQLITDIGRRVITIPVDIGNTEAVQNLVTTAHKHFGHLDILVNGAGVNIRQPAETFTPDDWDRLISVNLKSVFFACQAALPLMKQQGKGKIINIGSGTFERAVPNVALYAISKGGLRMLTRSLAVEWAPYGINVNAISPGRFWTEMTDAVFSDPELYKSAVDVIPSGVPGKPSDLAGATVLLASDAGDYITGENIFVDGGMMFTFGVKG